jgi:hypothetical protein
VDENGVAIGSIMMRKDDIAARRAGTIGGCYAESRLTPTARARLAKRKADEPMDPLDELLNDVTDYVNDRNDQ